MTKEQFLFQLEQRLLDIPEDERAEAMEYYRDYFDDAGEENEAQVIAELGSPDKVANSIKDGLRGNRGDHGMVGQPPQMRGAGASGQQQSDTRSKWILILLVAVITSPLWIGAAAGLVGVLIGVLVTIAALLVADVLVTVCGIVGGAICVIVGIVRLFTSGVVVGLMTIGVSLMLFAVGCFALVLLLLLCGRLLPWLLNSISNLMHRGSKRRKKVSVNE